MKVIGNIGNDVEKKVSKGGKTFFRFNLAENFNKGEQKETVWFEVNAFIPELDGDLLTKGLLVEVAGKLEGKAYTRADGTLAVSLNIAGFKVKPTTLTKAA